MTTIKDKLFNMLQIIVPRINGPYFLSDGLLLGLTRDNEFLPWDDDLDIYLLPGSTIDLSGTGLLQQSYYICDKIYDPNNVIKKLNPWFEYLDYKRVCPENNNLNRIELVKKVSGDYESTKINPLFTYPWIDIHYLVKDNDKYRFKDNIGQKYIDYYTEEEVSNLEKIEYNGVEFYIPSLKEQILSKIYGDDWKIPIKNFRYNKKKRCG